MDVYGLVGNPVEHSLSPPMHEAAYEALGMDARYVTFEPPADQATSAVESAQQLGVCGLNVTIPFKEDVLSVVEPTPTAARIEAVNTIDFSTDPPTGHNTDGPGLLRALAHHNVPIDGRAVVAGAGGAGRGAAVTLAAEGMTVDIANRTVERAQRLATRINDGIGVARSAGLDDLPARLEDADILVNATSVGMNEDRSPVPSQALHDELAVLDAVYAPLETTLLADARNAGATTVDGAWMLLYQGVEAFECWTDEEAPVEAMNDALREQLAE